jgi:hypothetical protein
MHATERPAADQPSTMSTDEALRLLDDTRRTLLKLVANIDKAKGAMGDRLQDDRGQHAGHRTSR